MLGFHISSRATGADLGAGFEKHVQDSLDYYARAGVQIGFLQTFVSGPQSYSFSKTFRTPTTCRRIRDFLQRKKVGLMIHGAYVDHPWTGQPKIVEHVKAELAVADDLGASGLVMHMPHRPDYRRRIFDMRFHAKTPIWLETSANCHRPDFNDVLEMIEKRRSTIRVVVDTAHLYASGIDIRYQKQAEEFFDKLAYPEFIAALHLNENQTDLGACYDRHASVIDPRARIWAGMSLEKSGLKTFVDFAADHHLPIILERHETSADELLFIKKMIEK